MISIIVPMYNACKTIERCLRSIMNQSFPDLEIIVIDDGSVDESQTIVKELAQKDDRIRYFRQENGGVSSARNHGIDESTGEYICFVDSDDAVTENYIALLYNSIHEKHSDVAMCGYSEITDGKKTERLITAEEERSLQGLLKTDLYVLRSYMCSPGMKIYRADMIKQSHLRFREDMALAEDQYFNFHYFELSKTVAFVNEPIYIYYRHGFGLSRAVNLCCFRNELENLSFEIDYMEKHQIEKREYILAEYVCYMVYRYTIIPNENNTRSAAVNRLKKIKLIDKQAVLPDWRNNLIYQFMYRKLYDLVYIYKKTSLLVRSL